jgi:hypothetical protein
MSLRGDVEREPVLDVEPLSMHESLQPVPELGQALASLEQLNTNQGRAPVVPDLVVPLQKAQAIAKSGSYAVRETYKTVGGLLRVYLNKMDMAMASVTDPRAGAMKQAVADARSALTRVTVKSSALTSLDPRYAEKRLRPTDPFVRKPGEANVPEHIGHSATKSSGVWIPAQLRDWPGPTADPATSVTGGMEFEVTAMAEASNALPASFLGSVRWGFTVVPPNTARLAPPALELADHGSASAAFFGAAKRWNQMRVPSGASNETPMQLPVHQAPAAKAAGGSPPRGASSQPIKARPPATTANSAPPSVTALESRWEMMLDILPVSKAVETKFGASYGEWIMRRGEPAISEWATGYLDWLTKRLIDDARQLDARWGAITKVLGNLSFAMPKVVPREKRNEAQQRYEAWARLYRDAKLGTFAKATVFFDEPTTYLDAIERSYKWWPAWTSGVEQLRRELSV